MDIYTEELYHNNSIFLFLIFIASVIAAILVWIFHSPITINLDRKAGQPVRLSLHLVPKLQ